MLMILLVEMMQVIRGLSIFFIAIITSAFIIENTVAQVHDLSTAHESSYDSVVRKEVLAAFDGLVMASKSLDETLYFQYFDEEKFIGLNSDGTNWNALDELRPLVIGGFNSVAKITVLEFNNVNVSVLDAYTAVLVNEYCQSMTLNNGTDMNVAGGGSQVWSKRSGQWKLVNISASSKANADCPQTTVPSSSINDK